MVNSFCLKANLILRVKGINSLKEKRGIIKRIKNLLDKKYNASVIESDFHESHEFISLTYSIVSNDKNFLLKIIEEIEERVEVEYGVIVSEHIYDIF